MTDRLLLEEHLTEGQLLEFIQRSSPGRKALLRALRKRSGNPRLARILEMLHYELQEYITGVEAHLRSTPVYKYLSDREIFTIREQYYLYMIEFELVNRLHIRDFLDARYRIALLPYCLREAQEECRAAADEVDFRCTLCRKNCQVNHVSQLLRDHDIEPYIWRNVRLKTLLRQLLQAHGSVGVLGIACLVELAAGMRKVMAGGIPVVGIPLNANRCPRWMGEMNETSVDLYALQRLITPRE